VQRTTTDLEAVLAQLRCASHVSRDQTPSAAHFSSCLFRSRGRKLELRTFVQRPLNPGSALRGRGALAERPGQSCSLGGPVAARLSQQGERPHEHAAQRPRPRPQRAVAHPRLWQPPLVPPALSVAFTYGAIADERAHVARSDQGERIQYRPQSYRQTNRALDPVLRRLSLPSRAAAPRPGLPPDAAGRAH
jgi:hypothetical protein